MKCRNCATQMRPVRYNDHMHEHYAFKCPNCSWQDMSEISEYLIKRGAYTKFLSRRKLYDSWKDAMQESLKEPVYITFKVGG